MDCHGANAPLQLDRHWPRQRLLGGAAARAERRGGAQVVRSILFEYTRIGADMCFSEMIVSPTYCVDRHGDTQYRGDEAAQLSWGDARG